MDTEKAVLDTESYQERLSFCVQILLVIVQLYKIVGFSQKVLAKKKNSIICTTTLTSQVV